MISVIIPAFNAAANLERAVDSVLATGRDDLEILVVDDGSHDETLAIAQRLSCEHGDAIRVVRHRNGINRGVSASRNLGIAQSRGEYICFLDADDYLYPHRFDHALEVLEGGHRVDGVYEATEMVFEGDVKDDTWMPGSIFGLRQAVESELLLGTLLKGQPWHPNAILCRRSLLEATGGFDESMRIAEDCNLWFRMAVVGNLVGGDFSKPVAAYCRHGANTFRPGIEPKVDMVRAMIRAYRWACCRASFDQKAVFRRGITDYLLNSIIVAREGGRQDVARLLIRTAIREGFLSFITTPDFIRQFVWICRETVMPRKVSHMSSVVIRSKKR